MGERKEEKYQSKGEVRGPQQYPDAIGKLPLAFLMIGESRNLIQISEHGSNRDLAIGMDQKEPSVKRRPLCVQAKTEYQERKFSDMYRDRSLCKDLNQGQRIVIKRRRRGLIEQFTQISSARFALKAPVLFASDLHGRAGRMFGGGGILGDILVVV
uniref:Uncharacterized protein n=1 Tax=Oryza sativa subsp. japonica TaxID=39947 RepID=Q6YWK5_ORYSJ|nr:unknown protein [Oryza sativa Japonica Group]